MGAFFILVIPGVTGNLLFLDEHDSSDGVVEENVVRAGGKVDRAIAFVAVRIKIYSGIQLIIANGSFTPFCRPAICTNFPPILMVGLEVRSLRDSNFSNPIVHDRIVHGDVSEASAQIKGSMIEVII